MRARTNPVEIGSNAASACAAVMAGLLLLSACESGVQVEQNVADAPGPAVATADPGRGADGEPGSNKGSGAIGGKGGRGGDGSSTADPAAPAPSSAADQLIEQPCNDTSGRSAGTFHSSASSSAAVYTGPGPTYTAVSCAAGFKIGQRFYSLSCGAVRADKVQRKVFATGRYYETPTEVRYIVGVDPDVLLAIRLPGGHCGDDDKVALSPWSMLFPGTGRADDEEAQQRAICSVTVEQHLKRNSC